MKTKLLNLSFCLLCVSFCQAQWQPNGATTGNIYYNNGNVGVGTSSPWDKFHVNGVLGIGTWNSDPHSGLQIQYSDVSGSGGTVFKHQRWSGDFSFKRNDASGSERTQLAFGGGSNHYLEVYNNNNVVNVRLNTAGDSYFTGGNLGIGTSAPADQLEIVSGNRKVGLNAAIPQVTTGGAIAISRGDDGTKTLYLGSSAAPADDNVIFSQGGATELRFVSNGGPYASAGFGFYVNKSIQEAFASTKPAPVMKIDGNGNVGIGTTDPGSFKLAVNGKIWSQEVNVAMTNPGPDYVFEKDYNLLPLSELENYITQNKHLPEVPSAKEMEKDGLNLKEMNVLLLKKVEELTLHVIEQNKLIKAQNDRIIKLESKQK